MPDKSSRANTHKQNSNNQLSNLDTKLPRETTILSRRPLPSSSASVLCILKCLREEGTKVEEKGGRRRRERQKRGR